ncbi:MULTISPECIES: NADPH-dependent FMN reductase [unclassified Shinella]|uniref:NADPH-dependent FMN reductase n=1 Tax=unclassified Shinella TaxID=2643062 RepID=UPI00234E5771|nr:MULTISPECIES: NADPH-dependent FMN reductase [unclassified Shinella]MCO5150803.1 NAD(P)H-dependent oxidoreductase [Shinella sp.]MDC7263186.1 NAD(P)H-dependent oxidoreductase [Shinella sp. HY16]MDC7270081.1 NAD(P)H-dependent oxidoreductase [Shinella sp. YZ44]
MTKLVAISGSLRKGSYNTALLRAALAMAPEGVAITEGSIHGIPLYDGDIEAEAGIPEAVTRLKELVAAADGVVLFTPEYNNGIPGVFKNAIDWMSRPSTDIARVFGGKPFAITGASPGNFGTLLSQEAWLPVMRTLGTVPWFGAKLLVSRAGSVIQDGRIADEATEKKLGDFIAGFSAFVTEYTR